MSSGAANAAARRSGRLLAAALAGYPAAAHTAALPSTPQEFLAAVESATAAIADSVAALAVPPAVSPAAGAVPAAPALAALPALRLHLGSAETLTAAVATAPAAVDAALLCAAAARFLGEAAALSIYAAYAARDEAFGVRARTCAAIDALAEALAPLTVTVHAAGASATIRALTDMRTRLVADINETIGRLPAVIVVQLDRDTDAFALANHLYGDDPAAIEAGYRVLVARNRPRHPARLPAGRVETLR